MKRLLLSIGVLAVVLFGVSVRYGMATALTCPPGRTCTFNVAVEDASVDQICFREVGRDAYLACKQTDSGVLHMTMTAVEPGSGPLVFEAVSIDANRSPSVAVSQPSVGLGLMPDPALPMWRNRLFVLYTRLRHAWRTSERQEVPSGDDASRRVDGRGQRRSQPHHEGPHA